MDDNLNNKLEEETENSENKKNIEKEIDNQNISESEDSTSEPEDNNIEDKEEDIVTLKKNLEETKDKLLRSLADNENTRKQMEKVRSEANRYGVQPLAREVLNVVDNFDRALKSKSNSKEESLEEGITLIQKEILSILEKFNIKKIEALGQEFNANYHQAMFEKETNDYEEGQVCEIVQDGYIFHDRLLRPSLVGVAKRKEFDTNSKIDESEEKN